MALVPPYIESLRPYEAGRGIEEVQREFHLTRVSKLASNENPLGASPKAVEALLKTVGGLNYYPNGGLDLRARERRLLDLLHGECGPLSARGGRGVSRDPSIPKSHGPRATARPRGGRV